MTTSPPEISVTPVLVGDLLVAEDERLPIYVHVIEHPAGRILVDTGLTEPHPAVEDMDPRLTPLDTLDLDLDLDLDGIAAVVNTHLHFDHCGGNHLFPGRPVYVQQQELDDARTLEDYTIPEWVDAAGVEYSPVDGEYDLLPGVRLLAAPGHTRGSQIVVVDSGAGGPVVIAGDTAVWGGQLDEPETEGQRLIRSLNPRQVWLSHAAEPWRPAED